MTWRARSSMAGMGLLELRPTRMSLEQIFLQLTTEEQPAEHAEEVQHG